METARLRTGWLLAFGAAVLGCGEPAAAKHGGGKPDRAAQAPRPVRLVEVESRTLAKTISVSGTLAADEQVNVGVKVAGRLASIAVDLGSVVERNQPIAQIEPTDYQLRVAQAESALAQARALLGLAPDEGEAGKGTGMGEVAIEIDSTSLVQEAVATLEESEAGLTRAQSLVDQKLIAPAEFDAAKASFVRAQSAVAKARDEIRNRLATLRQRSFELRLARQQLADTTVRAPLAGTVQERRAQAGEYLAAGADVAVIVRVNPLRLRAEVPERDVPLVKQGQSVRVTVEGAAAEHVGRVVRLAPALNEQNRSLAIEAEVENPGSLRPGSFARAEISVDDEGAVPVVPRSAVVSFAGIEKVLTVEDGKAVEHEITTGRRTEQWAEVISGIDAGAAVVAEPGNLQQGQPVTVAGAR